ncbi:hypothetical protein T11_18607 [Trichinella zimbabwensis]|uniref:Uncharacterized protein n=1 Tax=Trichinella zimbabwensis TaxID=268475 RepID=A0A0V1H8S3_9BILA|nr:hypothetical protein T11_18607 [Trichinella zimbabwensis]
MIKSTSAMLERSKQRKLSTDADSTVPTSKALTTLTNEAGHQSGQIFGNTFFECHLTINDNQVPFNNLISCNADSRIFVVLSQHSSQREKIISKIEQVFCLSWKLDNKYSALGNAIATNAEK